MPAALPADREGEVQGSARLQSLRSTRVVDAVTTWIGNGWCLILRRGGERRQRHVRNLFDTSNSWLELQWVLFTGMVLLCAP